MIGNRLINQNSQPGLQNSNRAEIMFHILITHCENVFFILVKIACDNSAFPLRSYPKHTKGDIVLYNLQQSQVVCLAESIGQELSPWII